MTFDEQIHIFLQLAATENISGGNYSQKINTPDGRELIYEFSLAEGMGWDAKRAEYSKRYVEIPNWVNLLHPMHRRRICDLSIVTRKPLPKSIRDEVMANYFARYQSLDMHQTLSKSHDLKNSKEESAVSKKNVEETYTKFDVSDSGTLSMANFWEPKIRSEFYETVYESWSESPVHLSDAMDECEPLAWAVHSIYTELRDEIQSDLDGISRSSGIYKKRTAALKARLKGMPEEPEDGVIDWLLALTLSEFEARVVPVIEEWFDSTPDWNWEDDHLPKDGTAQGAALEFFQNMDGDDLDAIGVALVYGEHPGSTYYAAELTIKIEMANKAATAAGIPVRFKKGRE